ncbi:hypothetical protein M1446_02005 [Candidatus Dependentiae bacterium]|nr:hypothetical protein [Candidatus Dependentiae bacterium]
MFFNKLISSIILNLVLSINLFSMEISIDPNQLQYPDYILGGSDRVNFSARDSDDDLVEDISIDQGPVTYLSTEPAKKGIFWTYSAESLVKYPIQGVISDPENYEGDLYRIVVKYPIRNYVVFIEPKTFWDSIRPFSFQRRARSTTEIEVRHYRPNKITQPNLDDIYPILVSDTSSIHQQDVLLNQNNNSGNILNIAFGIAAAATLFTFSDDIKNGFKKTKNKILKLAEDLKNKIKNMHNKKILIGECAFAGLGYYAYMNGKSREFAKAAFIASCLSACAYKYSKNKPKSNDMRSKIQQDPSLTINFQKLH